MAVWGRGARTVIVYCHTRGTGWPGAAAEAWVERASGERWVRREPEHRQQAMKERSWRGSNGCANSDRFLVTAQRHTALYSLRVRRPRQSPSPRLLIPGAARVHTRPQASRTVHAEEYGKCSSRCGVAGSSRGAERERGRAGTVQSTGSGESDGHAGRQQQQSSAGVCTQGKRGLQQPTAAGCLPPGSAPGSRCRLQPQRRWARRAWCGLGGPARRAASTRP